MKPQDEQVQLILDYKVPVVVADNSILLTKNGAFEIAFMQFNRPDQPVADIVAAVRLKDTAALEELKNAIEEHLKKEQNQEP